jgi:IS5 family transposase
MGRKGFWDERQIVSKLQDKEPVLRRLADSIPWELFRPLPEMGYTQERKSNAEGKRIDPLILLEMLDFKQLFNFSDEELEFQVNDRRSFEEHVDLGVMNSISGAKTSLSFESGLTRP